MPDDRDVPPAPADGGPDPGAPIPRDAIDPELVSLKPRRQIGLVTAIAVVAFAGYLMWRLWPDFRFAGEGKAREVAAAEVIAGAIDDESHVSIAVDLERAAALRARPSPGNLGLRVVPVRGAGDRLWVVLDGHGWIQPRQTAGYTGRLRRLSALPFEDALARQLRDAPPARHVTGEVLRAARSAGGDGGELDAITGDRFAVRGDDEIELVLFDPAAVTVVGTFDPEKFKDAETWRKALVAAGIPGVELERTDDDKAWFVVRHPSARADTDAQLYKAGLYGARTEPRIVRRRGPWRDAVVDAQGITLAGGPVPWSAIDVIAVHARRPLAGDPWVLVVGERPEDYWYVRPLYVALGIIAALFLWALVRTARAVWTAPRVPARV